MSSSTAEVRVVSESGAVPRRRLSAPRTGTVVAAAAGTVVSLAPGLLPRTAIAQGLLTGALLALFVGVSAVARKLLRHNSSGSTQRGLRAAIPVGCALAVALAVVRAEWWQNRLRAAMGFPDVGVGYWLECAAVALLVALALLGGTRAMRWAVRCAMRARNVTLTIVAALAIQIALLPATADGRRHADARADAPTNSTGAQPFPESLSENGEAIPDPSSLGAQGRRFMSAEAGRSVRVYAGLNSAPDLNSRVALVIRELERSGALARSNLVVMVPTGSGWVDEHAVTGLARRFADDVAMVAVQYSDAPSWVGYLFGRNAAEQSQRALFTALERRLTGLKNPPRLYIYGQSLGATAGSSVFTDDADQRHRVCAALWAGPPADRVHHAGARILANSSDPVVQWSPELLWHAPNLTNARPDAPHPPWIPLITFVQTSTDLLSALTPAPGHGHRYGIDQGTALGTCHSREGRNPLRDQAIGPRAAS
ncbi:alpha/beta-hydrolase family protein [Nocardia vaccinii]|uniref:alpha/beta-hydrolase family protein n=1 Tax=Nocardia vaccinii TaxID=1822 RepID=UPI0009FE98B0|nr:alpha/beta-hydrolase family protein [Nocardia vaccinii]